MLISKYAILKYNNNTTKSNYYKKKGYDVGKHFGYIFSVKIEDLSTNSNVKILVSCDFCNKIFVKSYSDYINQEKNGTCCIDCRQEKIRISNMKKYGVDNTSKLSWVTDKMKKTCLEKYGFVSNLCTDETKEKIRQTNLDRYGVEHVTQTENHKRDKKATNILRYGFENPMKNEEVKQKVRLSLFENGTCASSKAQRHICDLLKGILNYPFKYYNVDVFFPDLNIYLEYDGSGHKLQVDRKDMTEEEYQSRELIRFHYLKRQGLNLIRWINTSDKLPSDETLFDLFKICVIKLKKQNIDFIVINLDEL